MWPRLPTDRRHRAALALLSAGVLAALGLAMAATGLRRRLIVVTVVGTSMEPGYRHGERLLTRRVRPDEIARGQVVVLTASAMPGLTSSLEAAASCFLIKRVAAVGGDEVPACVAAARRELVGAVVPAGHLVVLGDNLADSHDSRHEGILRADHVRAVAVRSLARAARGVIGTTGGQFGLGISDTISRPPLVGSKVRRPGSSRYG